MDDSSDEARPWSVFRPVAKSRATPLNVAAKLARRGVMIADGYSEWQMNRAEAQRVANGVADTEGVVQGVYRSAQSVDPDPEPEVALTGPVTLIPPADRGFLRASIPGVTVVRPWADSRY